MADAEIIPIGTRGRPGRGSSVSPSRRCWANRDRHFAAIARLISNRSAISVFLRPSAAANTIRDRNAWQSVNMERRRLRLTI